MKTRIAFFAIFLAIPTFATNSIFNGDSLELAELIINLSQNIAEDLQRPSSGSERIISNATVTDNGVVRTFLLEGKDVNRDGRTVLTYWLRLTKHIHTKVAQAKIEYAPAPEAGRPISLLAQELASALLNSLDKIAEMSLDHRRIELKGFERTSQDPVSFEIIGLNNICEHSELNIFKIIITRSIQYNQPSYVTQLIHPYIDLN